jgi:hypothetical protein
VKHEPRRRFVRPELSAFNSLFFSIL